MALSQAEVVAIFGSFGPVRPNPDVPGGVILPEAWVKRYIVNAKPPAPLPMSKGKVARVVRCHRLIKGQLEAALRELWEGGNWGLIHAYGGCWWPRHMMGSPTRPLSRHTWGIAIDLNAALYPYGSPRRQEPALVEAFARHGFENGGDWSAADPMHFEAVRVMA